jgi:hypothetical protein
MSIPALDRLPEPGLASQVSLIVRTMVLAATRVVLRRVSSTSYGISNLEMTFGNSFATSSPGLGARRRQRPSVYGRGREGADKVSELQTFISNSQT